MTCALVAASLASAPHLCPHTCHPSQQLSACVCCRYRASIQQIIEYTRRECRHDKQCERQSREKGLPRVLNRVHQQYKFPGLGALMMM